MNPVLVELTRGGRVESCHRGAVAAVDASGRTAFEAGDADAAVFPRSAVKAILALPLIESGAADRFGLTDAEIAIACSSHGGEPRHVAAVESMLRKAGREATCLECGAHWPLSEAAARALAAEGQEPGVLHNNCSGKHAGFICVACARGDDPAGYVHPDHPVMELATAGLADLTNNVLDARNVAIDGCSIPTYAIPLRALASAFARFGTGRDMVAPQAEAARRIRAAVAAHPDLVTVTGGFDAVVMEAFGAAVFSKGGAEGVHCAALPELGLGLAVKCDDGATRAAQVMMAALLRRFLRPLGRPAEVLDGLLRRPLTNWNGLVVGEIRATAALLAAKGD
jgi:L-asparaginase II